MISESRVSPDSILCKQKAYNTDELVIPTSAYGPEQDIRTDAYLV